MLVLPKRLAWSLELLGMPAELRYGREELFDFYKKISSFQVDAGSFTVLGIGPAPVAQVGKQLCLDILSLIVPRFIRLK